MTLDQILALIQAGGAPMAVVFAGLWYREATSHDKTRAQLHQALDNTDKIAAALERITGISGGLK